LGKSHFKTGASILALLVVSSSPALAITTAPELLNDYNLIVFGNATSSSDVDGTAFIGGNLTGGSYDGHDVNTGVNALTVGGNLSGSVTVNGPGLAVGGNLATTNYNGNGGGNAYIGGSWTGSANFNLNNTGNVFLGGTKTGSGNVNGGNLFQNQNVQSNVPNAGTVSTIQNTLTSYSNMLGGLAQNSNFTISGGTATFNATPNAQGLAVFDISSAQTFFSMVNQISFNLNGAKEVVVNVSGAGTSNLNIAANFLGGQAQTLATDTIWNFTDAQSITIGDQFGGDFLAVNAAVALNQNLEGTLVALSLTQNAEVHDDGPDQNLVPQTPLPLAWPLFASALAAFGLFARRRARPAPVAALPAHIPHVRIVQMLS
jgi:choice-of-anchor A domain-containing protein